MQKMAVNSSEAYGMECLQEVYLHDYIKIELKYSFIRIRGYNI